MKIKHRVPVKTTLRDEVDETYEAEVQAATSRGEREYRKASERLARAEARRAKVAAEDHQSEPSRRKWRKRLIALEAEIELRRAELQSIARSMRSAPASSPHRGRKGTPPPVITPGELL